MTLSLKTLLYLVSMVCFALAALSVPTGRVGVIGAGLLCWEAAEVLA